MTPHKHQTLNVGVVGINERTLKMLELYFSRQCRGRYALSGDHQAQVMVADLDTVGGKKKLDQQMVSHPHRPVVAFTVRDVEVDGVQLLRKPIQLDALGKALDFFHTELDHEPVIDESAFEIHNTMDEEGVVTAEKEVQQEPEIEQEKQAALETELSLEQLAEIEAEIGVPPGEPSETGMDEEEAASRAETLSESKAAAASGVEPVGEIVVALEKEGARKLAEGAKGTRTATRAFEDKQRVAHECCGSREDIDMADPEARSGLFYHPDEYLQGSFEQAMYLAMDKGTAVELKMRRAKKMLFLPKANCVISDISDRLLRALCVQPVKSETDFVITQSDKTEEWLIANTKGEQCAIEPLHWKVTMWSSRGRVPDNTDLEGIVHLSNWPNFTRLMVIPQFMRMSAYWSQGEHSLLETAESLQIAQRHVLSFYSACRAMKLASVEAAKVTGAATRVALESRQNAKHHSMFGKILAHLRGG
ncbi:MAG: hypothetical protein RPT95_06430 [Candidatus Sedimenticola sp. (ex Thyasira tokunagai)]